jgi:hypothetical protein
MVNGFRFSFLFSTASGNRAANDGIQQRFGIA